MAVGQEEATQWVVKKLKKDQIFTLKRRKMRSNTSVMIM